MSLKSESIFVTVDWFLPGYREIPQSVDNALWNDYYYVIPAFSYDSFSPFSCPVISVISRKPPTIRKGTKARVRKVSCHPKANDTPSATPKNSINLPRLSQFNIVGTQEFSAPNGFDYKCNYICIHLLPLANGQDQWRLPPAHPLTHYTRWGLLILLFHCWASSRENICVYLLKVGACHGQCYCTCNFICQVAFQCSHQLNCYTKTEALLIAQRQVRKQWISIIVVYSVGSRTRSYYFNSRSYIYKITDQLDLLHWPLNKLFNR